MYFPLGKGYWGSKHDEMKSFRNQLDKEDVSSWEIGSNICLNMPFSSKNAQPMKTRSPGSLVMPGIKTGNRKKCMKLTVK